jgi:hypothetical protein
MDTEDILEVVDHDAELARQVSVEHERAAIRRLEERLHERFPAVSAPRIDEVVETRYHEFDNCKVRDYVPVLVEQAACSDLTHSRN